MRDAANNRGWLDFFPTPVAVTEEMLAAADIRPGMGVLEPSAGMGHIADRIREKGVEPVVAELEPQKRELLEAKGYTDCVAYITAQECSVVLAGAVEEADTLIVQEVVMEQTGLTADKIKIIGTN